MIYNSLIRALNNSVTAALNTGKETVLHSIITKTMSWAIQSAHGDLEVEDPITLFRAVNGFYHLADVFDMPYDPEKYRVSAPCTAAVMQARIAMFFYHLEHLEGV